MTEEKKVERPQEYHIALKKEDKEKVDNIQDDFKKVMEQFNQTCINEVHIQKQKQKFINQMDEYQAKFNKICEKLFIAYKIPSNSQKQVNIKTGEIDYVIFPQQQGVKNE